MEEKKVNNKVQRVTETRKSNPKEEGKTAPKYIYLWTEAEYSGHVPSYPNCGPFEVCLDTLNTTHENELELVAWANADGFQAEIGDGCVRIWKD